MTKYIYIYLYYNDNSKNNTVSIDLIYLLILIISNLVVDGGGYFNDNNDNCINFLISIENIGLDILILLIELYTQIGNIGTLETIIINTNGYSEILNSISSNTQNIPEILNVSLLSPLLGDTSINILKNLLLLSSLLSLIVGTVVGLAQTRIKRLFNG